MKNHPFTLAMPPNNIIILAICTLLWYMCRGGRGVCKLVHHHISNTKLTQRDDYCLQNRHKLPAHRRTRECASVLHRVRDDSHCACAKALLSRAKVRPKKISPRPASQERERRLRKVVVQYRVRVYARAALERLHLVHITSRGQGRF